MKVKNCNNCPFRVDKYDDFSTNFDTLAYCNLAKQRSLKDWIISAYNTWDEESQEITLPSWCPLKECNISIKLEEINK